MEIVVCCSRFIRTIRPLEIRAGRDRKQRAEGQMRIIPNRIEDLTERLSNRRRQEYESKFFIRLYDNDIPSQYDHHLRVMRELAGKGGGGAQVSGWIVRSGFTLKEVDELEAGSLRFGSLRGVRLFDEPTRDCLVFWMHDLLAGSFYKNARSQMAVLRAQQGNHGLPRSYLSSFGSASLLVGLILSHYVISGERLPADGYARTATFTTNRHRLCVGWRNGRLVLEDWRDDNQRFADLGTFALGAEPYNSPVVGGEAGNL